MKKIMMMLAVIVMVCSNFFGNSLLNAMAEEPDIPEKNCYYTSIMIESGDSLWSIAQEYRADTGMTVQEYVKQLKQMNGLKEDTIHVGQHLTVMYLAEVGL